MTVIAEQDVLLQLPKGGIDLEEVEREILRQTLEKHGGNQTRAAQYLNITPQRADLSHAEIWLGCG